MKEQTPTTINATEVKLAKLTILEAKLLIKFCTLDAQLANRLEQSLIEAKASLVEAIGHDTLYVALCS